MITKKQRQKLAAIDNMIKQNYERKLSRPVRFRPDQNVFAKLAKWLEIWAQNASDKNALDTIPELQEVLYKVSIIAGPFDLTTLIRHTTQYQLTECQLMLIKGAIEYNVNWKTTVKAQSLLPTVNSYVQLVS